MKDWKTRRCSFGLRCLSLVAAISLELGKVSAGTIDGGVLLEFNTSLTSLNLTGNPVYIPVGAGWTPVLSTVQITLSSQRAINPGNATLGKAFARTGVSDSAVGPNEPTPIDPNALDGQLFKVDSFFDVFFDITVTDVDPSNDFAGQADGTSFAFNDNGPAHMQSNYSVVFDKNAPNFGIVPPPELSPYIGHFNIEIPLGGDLNGNGEDDKIKFTQAFHSVGDENRSFITLPDGTVIDTFDSTAYLTGAVVDLSQDPPFTIGQLDPNTGIPTDAFGGPTTGTSRLVNPIVPEPSSIALSLIGLAVVAVAGRRRRRIG